MLAEVWVSRADTAEPLEVSARASLLLWRTFLPCRAVSVGIPADQEVSCCRWDGAPATFELLVLLLGCQRKQLVNGNFSQGGNSNCSYFLWLLRLCLWGDSQWLALDLIPPCQWFTFATVIKAESDNKNHCNVVRCCYETIYVDVSVKGAFGLMFMSSGFEQGLTGWN